MNRRFCLTRRRVAGFQPAHPPGLDHPQAPPPGTGTVACWWCAGDGCRSCDGSGLLPDQFTDPKDGGDQR
ncbi:hypothetical protein [Acrocarpospora corrugata]|uniref:hypothetical protein n=1 Tax=Acrocarpospora corrugata TaxID=35763 RepID=UPI0012D31D12|nr:hypothetical protein [Acrocarpospora corrugata]